MKDKVVTADEAISLVRDRDTLSSCGFVQSCVPEALLKALERRYLKTGSPRNLSLFATAGQGDSKTKGLSRLGHEGLLRKVVAGNWGRMPSVCQLAVDEKIYAYNLPQGIIAQLDKLGGGVHRRFAIGTLGLQLDTPIGGPPDEAEWRQVEERRLAPETETCNANRRVVAHQF